MEEVIVDLNWLDIIIIFSALVSFAWNIWQYVEKKKTVLPLKSMLTALFNDIKAKSLHAYRVQQLLYVPENPHSDIQTLRWDYYSFTNTTIHNLQGFQEIVVGLLVSLDPNDKEGKGAFKAFDYGLSDQDKEIRKKYFTTKELEPREK